MIVGAFRVLNQPHKNCMRIISWNINEVKTKLEKRCVQDLLLKYDVVSLNEVKTALRVFLQQQGTAQGHNKKGKKRPANCRSSKK